jgi:hypothetical protein
MADGERPAVGLSIGATNLAAVTAERSVTRRPVLTLYRQRSPEVGVPSGDPRVTESGLVVTGFVDRVGDPVGVVAADGSTHRGETLVADALRALAHTVVEGALPTVVTVTHPAHWGRAAVDALTDALGGVAEWSRGRLSLVPDSAAELTALQADPGVPSRGVIAVCDFGGSGTSLTLVDAANGYRAIAPTVRRTDFSGSLIDQALLNQVVANLSAAGSLDTSETSAISSLTRLRAPCRRAKEELSSTTTTALSVELPSFRGDITLTRTELDDAIRRSLDGFIACIQQTLQRNDIRAVDLAAVASVGGGASVPAVTRTLIEELRVPVITTPRPDLTAAVGAALGAARGLADGSETGLAPAAAGPRSLTDATTMLAPPPESSFTPELAWSEVDDDADSEIMAFASEYPEPGSDGDGEGLTYDDEAGAEQTSPPTGAWYRRLVVIIGAVVVMLAIAAILIVLRHTSGDAPTTPTTDVSSTPSSAPSAPATQSPGTQTSTTAEVPGTNQPPPPPAETTSSPPSATKSPSTTQAPTTSQAPQRPGYPPQEPRYPRYPPGREPQEPRNPFAPREPFAPRNPGFSQPVPQPEKPGQDPHHVDRPQ